MYEPSHTIPDLAMVGIHRDGNNLGAAVAVGEAIVIVHVDRKATNAVPPRSIPSPPHRNNIDEAS